MNSNQQLQIPAPCIQSWDLDSLQTQPGLFPVMHLLVPPPHPCFSCPLQFSMQTKPQTAALSCFADKNFGGVICKNKKSFLKSKRTWEGMRAQVLILLTGETGIQYGISSQVRMVSNLPLCEQNAFQTSQNTLAKDLNEHIFKFLQTCQLPMLFKSRHSSVCNSNTYLHTIRIFCVLPRHSMLNLWRKENLIYDCVWARV